MFGAFFSLGFVLRVMSLYTQRNCNWRICTIVIFVQTLLLI